MWKEREETRLTRLDRGWNQRTLDKRPFGTGFRGPGFPLARVSVGPGFPWHAFSVIGYVLCRS